MLRVRAVHRSMQSSSCTSIDPFHLGTILKWVGIALLPVFLLPLVTLILPGLVEKLARRISAVIDMASGFALGGAIACALALVMFQLSVVVLRYTYGISFTWLNELVIYAFAAMFMLGPPPRCAMTAMSASTSCARASAPMAATGSSWRASISSSFPSVSASSARANRALPAPGHCSRAPPSPMACLSSTCSRRWCRPLPC